MAFCPKCGAPLEEGSIFCGSCGIRIETASENESKAHQKSAWRKALSDFLQAKHKLPTLLKLAAVQFVPGIGRLLLDGYAFTWARARALGRNDRMPEALLRRDIAAYGLWAYVPSFAVMAAFVLISAALFALFGTTSFAFLALLVIAVLYVVTTLIAQTMSMRSVVCDHARFGFNGTEIKAILKDRKRRFLASAWVPYLINALITVALAALVMAVFYHLFGEVNYRYSSYEYTLSGYDWVADFSSSEAISDLIVVYEQVFLLALVAAFVAFFSRAIAVIVSVRAYGYLFEELNPLEWPECPESLQRGTW